MIDVTSHVQMMFPTGGNFSNQTPGEIIKSAAVTNQLELQSQ
jgi:hypothetical protein